MNTLTTHRTARKQFQLALGMIAGCLFSAVNVQVAKAAPSDDALSLIVKYDRQSLATESRVLALYRRLASAARQVCPNETTRDLARLAAVRRCREESLGSRGSPNQ